LVVVVVVAVGWWSGGRGGRWWLWEKWELLYMLLSAIVSLFFCRFWKPPRAGEVLPKFSIDNIIFLSFL
jgi:hypothetical protein